jgi:hypothetical protein
MPPLLMIELGCGLRVIEGIDLKSGAATQTLCTHLVHWVVGHLFSFAAPQHDWLVLVADRALRTLLPLTKMPPLLAALLMIELGCDLRIIEAIDRGMEWRRWQRNWGSSDSIYAYPTNYWYDGWTGCYPTAAKPMYPHTIGSFWWPSERYGERYPRDRLSH